MLKCKDGSYASFQYCDANVWVPKEEKLMGDFVDVFENIGPFLFRAKERIFPGMSSTRICQKHSSNFPSVTAPENASKPGNRQTERN